MVCVMCRNDQGRKCAHEVACKVISEHRNDNGQDSESDGVSEYMFVSGEGESSTEILKRRIKCGEIKNAGQYGTEEAAGNEEHVHIMEDVGETGNRSRS